MTRMTGRNGTGGLSSPTGCCQIDGPPIPSICGGMAAVIDHGALSSYRQDAYRTICIGSLTKAHYPAKVTGMLGK
jgi:hypothetical protein